MIAFLASVGAAFLGFLEASGRLALFAGRALAAGFTPPYYPRLILRQIVYMGYYSLPVVGLTALFTGMVLALQSYTGFARFNAEGAIATVVVLSVTRELGPVIAGLMVAGRVGAAMAAEIGTMRVTEQIDALTTLSTDPMRYLVLPRLLAGLVTLPLLVLVADVVGVFGGYLVGTYKLSFNPAAYLTQTEQYLATNDVVSGLIKAAVFGFLVALMGCYQGYHSRGGAEGVGQATTYAVVSASILILLSDYLLTQALFAPMSTAKIAVRGLEKSFGRKRVLDGLDIACDAGESLVIIGGSGTGKSVLIKCILGLLRPEAGSIRIDGEESVALGGAARARLMLKFGMLFQGSALFNSLSVWENVAFGLIQGRGMPRQEAREIALEKLASVGLGPEVGALAPAELSGGMQKRVALARAIAAEPEILFFDEPTTGLDPIMADVINDLIVDRVRGLGATAISITHDMVSARKIADRIAMLHKGRIIWQGPTAEIDRSDNPFVDQFVHGRAEGPIAMEVRAA